MAGRGHEGGGEPFTLRAVRLVPLLLVLVTAGAVAGERGDRPGAQPEFHKILPGARQVGPSCGFFANVPALTAATGVNLVDGSKVSEACIRSIYGLRSGDFAMRKSFSKELFFDLFGLEVTRVESHHEAKRKSVLHAEMEQRIAEVIDPALQDRSFISLRITGDMDRPHNILLVGSRGGSYRYHDPTSGRFYSMAGEDLAKRMLTRSSSEPQRTRSRYYSDCLVIPVGPLPPVPFTDLSALPASVGVGLTADQRRDLAAVLGGNAGETGGIEAWEGAFPQIRFVSRVKTVKGRKTKVSAVDASLEPARLEGLLHLARVAVHAVQSGRRNRLPVLVMDNRPLVVTGHDLSPQRRVVTCFDGTRDLELPFAEALQQVASSGALFGYVTLGEKGAP